MGKIWRGWKWRETSARVYAKATLSHCKYRNQLYLVSLLTAVLFSWSLVNSACWSLQVHRKLYFLEHFFSARAINENSFRRESCLTERLMALANQKQSSTSTFCAEGKSEVKS